MRKERERKKPSPTHKSFKFEFCCKQTAGITVMLFDSKSYWSLLLLIRIFPTHSQILPHRLCLLRDRFSDSLKMPAAQRKLFRENITLKCVLIPLAEMRHYVGVEWSGGDTAVKNDTASWAISFSGSKRNIWLDSAPKNTNPAKETAWVGSRQPSKQTPPALLASDTICLRSYSVSEPGVLQRSPCAEGTYCNAAGEDEKKRWKKVIPILWIRYIVTSLDTVHSLALE